MSISHDEVSTYINRGFGLRRLIEFLWKCRRNGITVSQEAVEPAETGLFFDSAIAGDL